MPDRYTMNRATSFGSERECNKLFSHAFFNAPAALAPICVDIYPGKTAFTFIPCPANSIAAVLVKPSNAAFDALYAAWPYLGKLDYN
ncbi:MAG: hypothetical protein M1510_11485, partial [Nitrospirae bacterium]|nr:hypothetical protein [Nitrospirota bacterium]